MIHTEQTERPMSNIGPMPVLARKGSIDRGRMGRMVDCASFGRRQTRRVLHGADRPLRMLRRGG